MKEKLHIYGEGGAEGGTSGAEEQKVSMAGAEWSRRRSVEPEIREVIGWRVCKALKAMLKAFWTGELEVLVFSNNNSPIIVTTHL